MENKVKKLTKAEKYAMLLAIEEVKNNEVLKAFIEKEMELLAKKNGSKSDKPSKLQKENEAIAVAIYEGMSPNRLYKCSEIAKAIPECEGMSTQKISPIMRKHEGALWVAIVDKKGTSYKRIEEEAEDEVETEA